MADAVVSSLSSGEEEHCFPLQLLVLGFFLPGLLQQDFKAFLLTESQKLRVDLCDVQMLKPIPAPPSHLVMISCGIY